MVSSDAKTEPSLAELAWLAQSMYTGQVPPGFSSLDLLPLVQDMGFEASSHGAVVCPQSALVVRWVRYADQPYLVFGGTTAGRTASSSMWDRFRSDSRLHLTQWVGNLMSAGGRASPNLRRAALLTARMSEAYPIHLIGHSKGAVEASFCAMLRSLPATVFGSPGLHRRWSESLAQTSQQKITHIAIERDPIAELPRSLSWLEHVGDTQWIKPPAHISALGCHLEFASLIESDHRA